MSRYYVLIMPPPRGETNGVRKVYKSWGACEKMIRENPSRAVYVGFDTEEEAKDFLAGTWTPSKLPDKEKNEIKERVEEYKQMEPIKKVEDTDIDASKYSIQGYSGHAHAVIGSSFNEANGVYGYGVVFIKNGKIEAFSAAGKHPHWTFLKHEAGELLGVMQAVRYAHEARIEELTIVSDCEAVTYAAYGYQEGKEHNRSFQAAHAYIREMQNDKNMKIDFKYVDEIFCEEGKESLHTLSKELAKKACDN